VSKGVALESEEPVPPSLKTATLSLCESKARQAAEGHYEHPEIQKSTRRQAKTSSIGSHWDQRQTTQRPTKPPTAVISKTKISPLLSFEFCAFFLISVIL